MPNHTMQAIIVSSINSDADDETQPIKVAYEKARCLFDDKDLISPLTNVGHNFVQSFCIFPTGSGNNRAPQISHQASVTAFCEYLASNSAVEFVAVKWSDNSPAVIEHTSENE